MSTTVLDSIIDGVRADLDTRRAATPLARIRDLAAETTAQRPAADVCARLDGRDTVGLIAEIKRSSPSKGALADIPEPADLARSYEAAGATAISVLTEQRRFGGSLHDLDRVRTAVDIPLLRKDFTVEEYQIYEARAHGADIVLLIVAALTDAQLAEHLQLTHELGMRALVEAHSADELERALATDARLIGVNARNLKTLDLDLDGAAALLPTIPGDRFAIGESAVLKKAHVETYARHGADAVLVGEALVTDGDPEATARDFLSVPAQTDERRNR
ncbi:indole-3-glycerol phosphate synthase TrpC [Helcobacillus massiliensis]|uniref:Indole-3-glycerol phosphate synthase n=1 Tax=Helcobacillus massiliensis TaxID=521392 RepID=A0A839QU08_9MICO|nr:MULTISPECIES: indole-3-glycerol phosphate synthase TrpC [Helcobacillus]MBB3022339.1 indole-3-glycerol phosphate synthase [Helcobacillus massiliensis]MCG7426441.1 indole-3-glycerol phosphate synthase TrpC [Helcobacillus sp. ACRRO]MCT1556978.1 indole-3-glycerol phosphate synthase TrpC [Helcobacillus massiliensis]MCT2035367.1 indole-3-glycerol phosphate synthase TrpC [Helcobacillus massiliensis]MCT2331418.1 indole-3-glycerol phosphate synthase TrpC [Helcobacillus massiliensis]